LLLALCAPAALADSLSWSTAAQPKKNAHSNGPAQMAALGEDPNIAVLFGGYTATAAAVRAWAENLTSSSPALGEFAVGAVFSVPGPYDSGFRGREIQVAEVAAAIAAEADKRSSKLIIVAAHSSGAFVADSTLAALAKKSPALLSRVAYFKLDGGWNGELTGATAKKLGAVFCVNAKCGKVPSMNFGPMTSCKGPSGGTAKMLTLSVPDTKCKQGRCCHDALVTTSPTDPNTFKVVADYSQPANSGWLSQASEKLKSLSGQ
jgi:hypothetical protein